MRKLGIPEKWVRAQEKMYESLRIRYKVGDAVSREHTRTNGFIQGLTGSLQAATVAMAIWDRAMKEAVPSVRTGGFIDDTNLRAQGEYAVENIMKAWAETKQFDELVGYETNKKKTKAFANI